MDEQENEQLMLFREDSPASHFPWLESKKAKGTTVTYGRKCSGLSENLSRVGYLVRTYLESCELPLPTLSRTWSVKDLTSSCLILKLRLSALRTEENGSRLWPTPNTMDSLPPKSQEALTREATQAREGRTSPANLRDVVNVMEGGTLWPTPTTGAGLCGGTGNYQQLARLKDEGVITEEERRNMAQGNGGSLNPTWVEWLMGFPKGWTDLNVSEMP